MEKGKYGEEPCEGLEEVVGWLLELLYALPKPIKRKLLLRQGARKVFITSEERDEDKGGGGTSRLREDGVTMTEPSWEKMTKQPKSLSST